MSMSQRLSITVEESGTPDAQTVVEVTSTLDDDTLLILKLRATTSSLKGSSLQRLEPVWKTFLNHIQGLISDLSSNETIGRPRPAVKDILVGQKGTVASGQLASSPSLGSPLWNPGNVGY